MSCDYGFKIDNVKRVKTGDRTMVAFQIPDPLVEHFWQWLRMQIKHDGTERAFSIHITRYYQRHSTGPYSQGNHAHGHAATIAKELGWDLRDVKEYMKENNPDWPRKVLTVKGKEISVPISDSEADTVAEASAIEFYHRMAAENDIYLVEE